MPLSTPPGLVEKYEGAKHFRYAFAELHAPAIRQAGYEVIPPMVENSEVIQAEIIRNLATADLVVCDLSTLNPNVFFELGIRVAMDRPVALIKDDQTPAIPFDNAPVSCHTYASQMWTWTVREEIPRLAEWVRRAGEQDRNALWRHFGHVTRADLIGNNTPRAVKDEPANAEFYAAVDRLVEIAGLARRRWEYDLGVDPPRRAVRLTLAALPSPFLRDALREEAANLGLRLEVAVRLTPPT